MVVPLLVAEHHSTSACTQAPTSANAARGAAQAGATERAPGATCKRRPQKYICTPLPHPPREVWEGGGVWDPRVCVPQMARPDFPSWQFRSFARWSLWTWGGDPPPPMAYGHSNTSLLDPSRTTPTTPGLSYRTGRLPSVTLQPTFGLLRVLRPVGEWSDPTHSRSGPPQSLTHL